MASRTTHSELSTPPLTGVALMTEYSDRFKSLFDASALSLTSVGGTGDAVTATLDPALDGGGLVDGMKFQITWGAANTAGVTLALNGAAAVPVVDPVGSALVAGALASGLRSLIEYIGGSFRVLSPLATSLGGGATSYYTQITASATWNKPAGYDDDAMVILEAWGGGGGGGRTNTAGAGGGGGGGYSRREMRYADVPSSVSVTIGSGGAGRTGSTGNGSPGTNTSIGTLLTAYSGGGGSGVGSAPAVGGGGGGELGVGATAGTGGYIGGGDGGSGAAGGPAKSIWGGGGGAGQGSGQGGGAVHGGGGGGGATSTLSGAGGNSLHGGGGGAGNSGGDGTSGTAPGGGGGGAGTNNNGGDGARGEVRIWII